jgi:tetratricopeptide (TPR) repeat protein
VEIMNRTQIVAAGEPLPSPPSLPKPQPMVNGPVERRHNPAAGRPAPRPSSAPPTAQPEEAQDRLSAREAKIARQQPGAGKAKSAPSSTEMQPPRSTSPSMKRAEAAGPSMRPSASPRRDEREDRASLSFDDSATQARPTPAPQSAVAQVAVEEEKEEGPPALTGKLAEIVGLIKHEQVEQALVEALRWRAEQPGDVLALIGLGEALQAMGRPILAARVYGSIIDLFPSRADMLRFAGERLDALGTVDLDLARDAYQQAVKQRPDHQAGHHLLAMALLRLGRLEEAMTVLEAGLNVSYRIDRAGTLRILQEDLSLVAAALAAKDPQRRSELIDRLGKFNLQIAQEPSLRFVLNWETDANDVDFHIYDGQGGHAYYSSTVLPSGGSLFGDVRNGYGPECFSIPGPARAFPYKLKIHYYSRGPMGYGMGKLQIIEHDGKGNLAFEDRPFVAMNDQAYVNLGLVNGPLQK